MKSKKLFYLLFILSAIILLMFLIINTIQESKSFEILSRTKTIDNVRRFSQGDEFFVSKPQKVLFYKNKIFVLDLKFFRVLVFENSGYSYFIGHPGQGPSEISQPISMAIENDTLYILNSPDRIEVFDLSGKYLRTIRLGIKSTSFKSICDFKIYDQKIYISLLVGEIAVQRYNLNGQFIDNLILDANKIDQNKTVLANPRDIFIIPKLMELILFNRFTGDIEIFNLTSGAFINRINNYDTVVEEKVSQLRKTLDEKYDSPGKIEIKVFVMFHANLDSENLKLHILPSQSSMSRENMRDIIYTFNVSNCSLESQKLYFNGVEKKYIRNCYVMKDSIVFIDDELNLFIGGFK